MPGSPVYLRDMTSTSARAHWHSFQCFGVKTPGENVEDADIISVMDFDLSGNFLATGDKGGRVVLFERHHNPEETNHSLNPDVRTPQTRPHSVGFRYLTEFQSHLPEFDYLKSLEIEEKINCVRWCRSYNTSKMLLSANDKTIKLWRVSSSNRRLKHMSSFSSDLSSSVGGFKSGLHFSSSSSSISGGGTKSRQASLIGAFRDEPDLELSENSLNGVSKVAMEEEEEEVNETIESKNLRVFGNAHAYHINSISVNSDQETFLSSDDLRIHLWNLEVTNTTFNIVDLKPDNMEDLTEVITCSECHPQHCFLFAYSSSKGLSRLVDRRQRALCDYEDSALLFESPELPQDHSLFSEIVNSISDLKFSGDGRYLLTRDYLTLKLWDLNMNTCPVQIFNVNDHLRGKLYDLYECDRIFDKFTCALSHDGQRCMTGSYDGYFRVFEQFDKTSEWVNIENTSSLSLSESPEGTYVQENERTDCYFKGNCEGLLPNEDVDVTNLSLADNVYQLAWHPHEDIAAVAASNTFYMFAHSA
eukprot:g8148.t1